MMNYSVFHRPTARRLAAFHLYYIGFHPPPVSPPALFTAAAAARDNDGGGGGGGGDVTRWRLVYTNGECLLKSLGRAVGRAVARPRRNGKNNNKQLIVISNFRVDNLPPLYSAVRPRESGKQNATHNTYMYTDVCFVIASSMKHQLYRVQSVSIGVMKALLISR